MAKRGVKPMPVRINGVDYASVREAAEDIGLAISTIYGAIEDGRTESVGFRKGNGGKETVVDGVTYPSRQAAAKALGLHKDTIRKRFNRKPRPSRKTA